MEVLASRLLLRPRDPARTLAFYRDVLGLSVAREFGPAEHRGTVFHAGGGFVEVSGQGSDGPSPDTVLWLQVRDVRAEHARLAGAGVTVRQEPRVEPWGLVEAWVEDPDGLRIVLVEVPADHPLRRDVRS